MNIYLKYLPYGSTMDVAQPRCGHEKLLKEEMAELGGSQNIGSNGGRGLRSKARDLRHYLVAKQQSPRVSLSSPQRRGTGKKLEQEGEQIEQIMVYYAIPLPPDLNCSND